MRARHGEDVLPNQPAGPRHYEADVIPLKMAMLVQAALKGIANKWWEQGYRVVQMAPQGSSLVLLLEHIECDCRRDTPAVAWPTG